MGRMTVNGCTRERVRGGLCSTRTAAVVHERSVYCEARVKVVYVEACTSERRVNEARVNESAIACT